MDTPEVKKVTLSVNLGDTDIKQELYNKPAIQEAMMNRTTERYQDEDPAIILATRISGAVFGAGDGLTMYWVVLVVTCPADGQTGVSI